MEDEVGQPARLCDVVEHALPTGGGLCRALIAGRVHVVLPVVVRVPVVRDRDDAFGQSPHPQRVVLGRVLDAAVVQVTELRQNGGGALTPVATRRTEATRRDAGESQRRGAVEQQALPAAAVELGPLLVHPSVQPDLVSGGGDGIEDVAVVQGVPALDEERCPDAVVREQREHARHATS